jgi:hypothetical protein
MWTRSQESQNGAKDKNFACWGALKVLAVLKHFRPKNLFVGLNFFLTFSGPPFQPIKVRNERCLQGV